MAAISFSSATNALRLKDPSQYPTSQYPGRVMTYSFWGLGTNGIQGTAEGRTGGYQSNNGAPVRSFLNVPSDIRTTTNAALSNISKFTNLTFQQVNDTGFTYSTNSSTSQRGRIRIMVDGLGTREGSSHGPAGGSSTMGGETFFRPWPAGTTDTSDPRKDTWLQAGATFVAPTNYLNEIILHELQHSLGLGHGHDGGSQVRGVATEHSPESDNVWNTAQSYNGPLGWIGNQSTMVATSMPDDIASLQSIYGARAFNNGANNYTFRRGDLYLSSSGQQLLDTRIVEARIANVNTLDDSGGMDNIDCSDVNSLFANEGVRIDMRPGGYVISKNDWDNPLTYTDNNGIQRGTLVTGIPQKGTRLSWRTTIENCQGTEFGSDTIIGNSVNNWIAGYGGNDFLQGLDGGDTLIGGYGSDQFFGGTGSDLIYLGGGDGGTDTDKDYVDFSSANDSPASANGFDKIYGFGNNDVFDLNDIDGNTRSSGRQSLSFIGSRDFSGRAGELRLASASGAGTRGFIEADTNADRRADFRVALTGESTLATTLTANNFILTY
jgi:hypothetical protein